MSGKDIAAWSVAQCHIAAANMMTAAAISGIDSCPVGGFDADQIARILDIDPTRFTVALVLPLGYRAEQQPIRHRLSLAELVDYR